MVQQPDQAAKKYCQDRKGGVDLCHAKVFEHRRARPRGAPYGGAAALTRLKSKHWTALPKNPSGAFFNAQTPVKNRTNELMDRDA